MKNAQGCRKLLQALLWLVYPLVIFFGLQFLEPRLVALLLALSLLLRRIGDARQILVGLSRPEMMILAVLLCMAAITAITNSEIVLRLYPAAVSCGMLLLFSLSLIYPPSMVERFARLREPNLPPSGVIYTRYVTQFWCGFFVLNGTIAIYTALYASRDTWALYNGLIAYILMGIVFAGEWLVRRYFTRRAA